MTWLVNLSVLTGALPVAMAALGELAWLSLLVRLDRHWWYRQVMASALGTVLVTSLVFGVLKWWQPFPDPLPAHVWAWIGIGLFAVCLGVARTTWRRPEPRRRGLLSVVRRWTGHRPAEERPAAGYPGTGYRTTMARRIRTVTRTVLAVICVVLLAALKINSYYGYRPTLGSALGYSGVQQTDFAQIAPARPTLAPAGPRLALDRNWVPPAGLPKTGQISQVRIPGVRSRFPARPAWLYVPPAYTANPRPLLPVLVLIAGQPGGPEDWFIAGRLASVLDEFASTHSGLAPIVLVPDATGSALGNSLCLDSRLGNSETYLTHDVPDWIRAHLQVDPDTSRWTVGGFSFGGTCALQLAVRAPHLFPTFLDISGQVEPTLGDRARTVRMAFGGNERQFDSVDPLIELSHTRLPTTEALIAFGADDREYGPQADQVAEATRSAGMTVVLAPVPGGHSWTVAITALRELLPRVSQRAGLIGPAELPVRHPTPTPRGFRPLAVAGDH
ncbi:MAG TPA: alpha/beta hydrolase-fold protein [Pseudonocardia sp.]|nr:alpha/beta hydrolase-fold protein [Pseudonocardia sp.]